eukprot:13591301-Ditylum_brightwellii.AAC.1
MDLFQVSFMKTFNETNNEDAVSEGRSVDQFLGGDKGRKETVSYPAIGDYGIYHIICRERKAGLEIGHICIKNWFAVL